MRITACRQDEFYEPLAQPVIRGNKGHSRGLHLRLINLLLFLWRLLLGRLWLFLAGILFGSILLTSIFLALVLFVAISSLLCLLDLKVKIRL